MEFSDHFPAMSDWIFAGAQAEARWRGVAVRLRQLSGGRGGTTESGRMDFRYFGWPVISWLTYEK